MTLYLRSKLSTYGLLQTTLRHPDAEFEIKKVLSTFFGAPLENIFITIIDRFLTIRILEISSIDEIRYTLRISKNIIVSLRKQHIFHPASEICNIFLNARIERSDVFTNDGLAVELEPIRQEHEIEQIRQEQEPSVDTNSSIELERPIVEPFIEPFIPIRQENRSNLNSLRIEIPNGSSVSFDINVNMVVYPHVAEPEDFQHTVSRCRINDVRILNSPSKRQRVESHQEMVVLLPHADEITLEILRRSCLETREISREILSFLEILRGGFIKFSRHTNPIQFMFNDFRLSYISTTTLECIHWSTSISYESYRRSVEFIGEVNAFIKTIINQYL
jgi:hypothetical protein